MKRMLIFVAVLLISSMPLLAKGGAAPPQSPVPGTPMLSPIAKTIHEPTKSLTLAPLSEILAKGGVTCNDTNPDPISCNTSENGFLQTTDCLLNDDTVADFWIFNGTAGDEVQIDMTSDDFDTFLFLLDTTPATAAVDNDSGEGTNSQITQTLDQTGVWAIAANNFAFIN